ncbi:thioredoxin [Thermospira aquatica]|uniref:Thioredoxin n=1 Tax=Thermospira aquatica TaxID=2828656 RepID=A0AAX3BFR7_9SPIR|nr:thioredoxin [Thermospira aquatica]URA11069.1 thioredoxin [Thermospira aquatica]
MEVLQSSNFEKTIQTKEWVIVDFWAEWCRPCLMLAPIFEQTAQEMPDITFAKVNVDEEGELAMRFGISSIPALILFHKGQPVATHVGTISKERLKQWIQSHR